MDILSKTITSEEFLEFTEQHPDKRYELIDGVIVEMPSPSFTHGLIAGKILALIWFYVFQYDAGYPLGEGYDFELASGDIFKPDGTFIVKARVVDKLPHRIRFAPDLALEVISPSNTAGEIAYKTETFIRYGTQIVWVAYPDRKAISVYTPAGEGSLNVRTLTKEEILDGGTVLPGFSVKVGDLFPDIEQE